MAFAVEAGQRSGSVVTRAFLGGGLWLLLSGGMNRVAIFGVDVGKDRGFGKFDWLRNGRLWKWTSAFPGLAATVKTRFFFAGMLHHSSLTRSQAPTPQSQGRSAPVLKRRNAIRGKDNPTSFR